jgi:hypothetical protein
MHTYASNAEILCVGLLVLLLLHRSCELARVLRLRNQWYYSCTADQHAQHPRFSNPHKNCDATSLRSLTAINTLLAVSMRTIRMHYVVGMHAGAPLVQCASAQTWRPAALARLLLAPKRSAV